MDDLQELAVAAQAGDRQAADDLFRLVYDDLRRLADHYLNGERTGHTLQPTALVHEVYVRLLGGQSSDRPWQGRSALFAAASRAMRQVLVDSARRKRSLKRGGGVTPANLNLDHFPSPETPELLLALNEALDTLAQQDAAVAELVTLRYFGGLTVAEAAEVLGVSPRTAANYWAYARAWLLEALDDSRTG